MQPISIYSPDPRSQRSIPVRAYQYSIEQVTARGGVLDSMRLELVPFDKDSLHHARQQRRVRGPSQ